MSESFSESITLKSYGVHDPEKQLPPGDVVVLKEELRDPRLCAQVCAAIVTEMVLDSSMAAERTLAEQMQQIGFSSIRWFNGVQEALGLPGAEWPSYMTPPATFAHGLELVQIPEGETS